MYIFGDILMIHIIMKQREKKQQHKKPRQFKKQKYLTVAEGFSDTTSGKRDFPFTEPNMASARHNN
jgi:hypothetical protein